MTHPIRDHLIEEILLNAHIHRELGVDPIEEYFVAGYSLDHITIYAQKLLLETEDPEVQRAIQRNLSECIVVKAQNDRYTITGIARSFFVKLGLPVKRSSQIQRAEQFLKRLKTDL